MARTEMQRESFRQLEWALSFSQLDLAGWSKDQMQRLDYELVTFIQKAQGVDSDPVSSFLPSKGFFPRLQTGIEKRFKDLAGMAPLKIVGGRPIEKSRVSSTSFHVDGAIDIRTIDGEPYRQIIRARGQEDKVYAALASHLLASGIVAGQIRNCPQCGRVFLLKLKPQPDREFHCSTKCTNQATFRRYKDKRAERGKRSSK
jgi:hypothetical protein